ncbi:unnamed protein product [Dovyalis caffra]|uniref:Uncharacterized protein n=1 Tax=Dovyalis caffra TaxID=77055 RepID=A0AAV1RVN2_9ROSI|nr:unnamed protein product [Dovyalis caffra]
MHQKPSLSSTKKALGNLSIMIMSAPAGPQLIKSVGVDGGGIGFDKPLLQFLLWMLGGREDCSLPPQSFFTDPDGNSPFYWSEKQKEADCCEWTDIIECDTTTKRVIGLSLWGSGDRSMHAESASECIFVSAFQRIEESQLS